MKKISVFLFAISALLICRLNTFGQVNSYTFSQSNGTYSPLIGATNLEQGQTVDDVCYAPVPIGFNFSYHGNSYSTIGISTNGIVVLGSIVPVSIGLNPLVNNINAIAALGADLYVTNATNALRYQTTGGAGNQIFTVEWYNWGFYPGGGLNEINFQLKLYESNNAIEIIYDPTNPNTSVSCQVGMTGDSVVDFTNRKTYSTWSNTTSGFSNLDYCPFNNFNYPDSGLIFKWTPCTGAIGGVASVSSNSICVFANTVLSLTGNSGAVQWQISSGASFSNINGAINPNYNLDSLPVGNYVIRAMVTCGGNMDSSNQVSLSVNLPTNYVLSGITSVCYSSITVNCNPSPNACGLNTISLNYGAPYFATFPYTATGLSPGNCMVNAIMTDCNGCVIHDSLLFHVYQNPLLFVSPASAAVCIGDSTQLTFNGSGGMVYSIPITGDTTSNSTYWLTQPNSSNVQVIGTTINGCADTAYVQLLVDSLCVWPGDANRNGNTDNADLINVGLAYGNTGTIRPNASIVYAAQPSLNWGTSTISVNDKHADTNGDGIVDANDTLAISQNFGLTHPRLDGNNQNNSLPPLQLMILEDTVLNMDTVHCLIIVGDTMNVAGNIYGLAYTIGYDNTVVDTNTAHISYFNSTLAPAGNNVSVTKDFWVNGNIKSGVSRIDQTNFNGNAVVGMCEVDITTDNIDGKLSTFAYQSLHMTIGNITAVDANGNDVQLQPMGDSVYIKFTYTDEDALNGKDLNMLLFPNPTTGELNIAFKGSVAKEINIENVIGQTVYTDEKPTQINTVDVSSLPNGIYLVRCSKGNKSSTQKLVIAR